MTDQSRKAVLKRRAGGQTDLSSMSLGNGSLSLSDAMKENVWTINSSQMVGIATATEQGLTVDRYPVRVILGEAPPKEHKVSTCIRYWPVTNMAGIPVEFSRRPLTNVTPVVNLYKTVPDFDDKIWEYIYANPEAKFKIEVNKDFTALSDEIYGLLSVPVLTIESSTALTDKLNKYLDSAYKAGKTPYIRIGPEFLLILRPHGYIPSDFKGISSAHIPIYEMYLNLKVNADRISTRYGAETLTEGTYVTAAYAIAAMFRFGLFEAYESNEFYTAYASPMEGEKAKFTVSAVTAPRGLAPPADMPVGSVVDISSVKADKKMFEIAPGMCVAAGLNHYMFNHTTGGSIASGSVLTYLGMFNLMKIDQERKVAESVTSVFYEALHPVNKRAIANLFFKKSNVWTHGRSNSCMRYEQLKADSFISIRMQPQPAGAHKAFVCIIALKRVIEAGLSPFLPWSNSLNDCITTCESVLKAGAEAHIGAMYYIGRHGSTQSSSLDNYLPELACYMQSMAKHDTLTMSPHLSLENAARAALSWQNLMKDLKGADFQSTDPEIVRRFLASQGKVFMDFDITKEEDWGKASVQGQQALAAVNAALI